MIYIGDVVRTASNCFKVVEVDKESVGLFPLEGIQIKTTVPIKRIEKMLKNKDMILEEEGPLRKSLKQAFPDKFKGKDEPEKKQD